MISKLNNIIVNLGEITLKRKVYISCVILLMCQYYNAISNDGAYLGSGNHLIPITESEISIKKEILSIKRDNNIIKVDVYYEMYNPGEEKTIRVGFEANSAGGDAQTKPKDGKHPYMDKFSVDLNNQILKYNISYVIKKENNTRKKTDLNGLEKYLNENEEPYIFVYYFDAKFTQGVNIIKHSYNYHLSSSVMQEYSFDYILTAANRWANKGIDDFTLIIDMGEIQSFEIPKTFYNSPNEWKINGIGKVKDASKKLLFFIEKGNIEFNKIAFHPKKELEIISPSIYTFIDESQDGSSGFNPKKMRIPYSVSLQESIPNAQDEFSKKILRNLPFARRGYIFKDKLVQKYYSKMTNWYTPKPEYQPEVDNLSKEEKEWVKKYK